MIGTLLNVGTVLAGGTIGTLVGGHIPLSLRQTLMQAVGLTTLAIGVQDILPQHNPILLLASVLLGGLIGELLRIEQGIDRLGALAERAVSQLQREGTPAGIVEAPGVVEIGSGVDLGSGTQTRAGDGDAPAIGWTGGARGVSITQGFVTASLIFCVGPMTILGSFQDGLTGAYETLALKAMLDGITAAMLASSLGWGVLLSAGTVLLYQGALTLGAGLTRGLLTDQMVLAMTASGGLLIMGIGLNILEVTRIRVGSMLPSLVVAPVLTALSH